MALGTTRFPQQHQISGTGCIQSCMLSMNRCLANSDQALWTSNNVKNPSIIPIKISSLHLPLPQPGKKKHHPRLCIQSLLHDQGTLCWMVRWHFFFPQSIRVQSFYLWWLIENKSLWKIHTPQGIFRLNWSRQLHNITCHTEYLLLLEVPRGSKSSKSSSYLFGGMLELWEGIELYLSESFDFIADFEALDDILSWSLLQFIIIKLTISYIKQNANFKEGASVITYQWVCVRGKLRRREKNTGTASSSPTITSDYIKFNINAIACQAITWISSHGANIKKIYMWRYLRENL